MTDAINGSSGYRDYWNDYATGNAGKTDSTNKSDGTDGTKFDAVFEDKKMGVSVDDFLGLMVAQLRNQDFMNPVDDTQYVTQLAQFATMQSMQEMSGYMKTNYALSLVGKEVTAAKFTVSGDLDKQTGTVQKVSLVNGEYTVYINDKKYALSEIMEVGADKKKPTTDPIEENSLANRTSYLLSLMGQNVTVATKDEDGKESTITGIVDRVTMKDGIFKVCIDDVWYLLDDVVGADRPPREEPKDPEVKPPDPTTPTDPKPTDPTTPTDPKPTDPTTPTDPKPTDPASQTQPEPTNPDNPAADTVVPNGAVQA